MPERCSWAAPRHRPPACRTCDVHPVKFNTTRQVYLFQSFGGEMNDFPLQLTPVTMPCDAGPRWVRRSPWAACFSSDEHAIQYEARKDRAGISSSPVRHSYNNGPSTSRGSTYSLHSQSYSGALVVRIIFRDVPPVYACALRRVRPRLLSRRETILTRSRAPPSKLLGESLRDSDVGHVQTRAFAHGDVSKKAVPGGHAEAAGAHAPILLEHDRETAQHRTGVLLGSLVELGR